jgi:hypothetical protein
MRDVSTREAALSVVVVIALLTGLIFLVSFFTV